jgi:hypothetical protein
MASKSWRDPRAMRELLRQRGVPEAFIENIAGRKETLLNAGRGLWALVPVMALMVFTFFPVMAIFEDWGRNADESARQEEAWFASIDIGVIGVIWVCALFSLPVAALGWLLTKAPEKVKPFPAPNLKASQLRMPTLGDLSDLEDAAVKRVIRAVSKRATTADEFLLEYSRWWERFIGAVILGLLTACVIGMALTHRSSWTVGPAGIVVRSLWSTTHIGWSEASRVAADCRYSGEDGAKLNFDVHARGRVFKLVRGSWAYIAPHGRTPEAIVSVLENADAKLIGVVREKRSGREGDPMHGACLDYFAAAAGVDGLQRIKHLLRVSE